MHVLTSGGSGVAMDAGIGDPLRSLRTRLVQHGGLLLQQSVPGPVVSALSSASAAIVASRVACLTSGLGVASLQDSVLLRDRLCFWPQGRSTRRTIALASSRIGRRPDERTEWFSRLRTAVMRMDGERDALLIVPGTASAQYALRAGELFGVPRLLLLPLTGEEFVGLWRGGDDAQRLSRSLVEDAVGRRHLLTAASTGSAQAESEPVSRMGSGESRLGRRPTGELHQELVPVFVSPVVPSASSRGEVCASESMDDCVADPGFRDIPERDHLLFEGAERVVVLSLRNAGNTYSLVHRAAAASDRPSGSIWLACHSIDAPSSNLLQSGVVVPWLLNDRQPDVPCIKPVSNRSHMQDCGRGELSSVFSEPSAWLLHWTRRHEGPWSGQSIDSFHDELILGCRTADRSALVVLMRILSERCLRASGRTIRGGFPVVSWTDVGLSEFRSMRRYQRHRRRYDFEPWGIGVRKSVLRSLGAQPVQYGPPDLWESLSEAERPFFQKEETDNSRSYEHELEWRLRGDLDLARLSPSDWFIFVDTVDEQLRLEQDFGIRAVPVPGVD